MELLEKKGLCSKQDLYDIIAELRTKNLLARLTETVFPSPSLMTETEEQVINDLLAVINKYGVDAKQSLELLEHLGRIIEMGLVEARRLQELLRQQQSLAALKESIGLDQ